MSHELPSQSDWITRASRTLVHLGFVPSLALVTVVLVPVFAMLAPLLVLMLGVGSPMAAAQIGALSALILVPCIGAVVLRLLFQLERARARLAVLATQDALTGVHNRRYFFEIAEREWQRCKRYGEDTRAAADRCRQLQVDQRPARAPVRRQAAGGDRARGARDACAPPT